MPILMIAGLIGLGLAASIVIARAAAPQGPRARQAAEEKTGPAVSSDPSEDRTTRPENAGRLLQRAILTLESRRSVSARIRHSACLFGQRPAGSGIYLEQRTERGVLLRFEVRTQLAGEPSSLLQVCDGRYLWVYEKLGDEESLSRIDVARVGRVLGETGNIEKIASVGWWPGLGGLPKLLRALHAAFDFRSLEEAELAARAAPLPVWRLQGTWKPHKLGKWLPEPGEPPDTGKPPELTCLPRHLPDHVVLYLGKTDLFPYRIEYRRRAGDRPEAEDPAEDLSLVTMQLYEVRLNGSIHPAQFLYNPGELEWTDTTGQFLKGLRLAR